MSEQCSNCKFSKLHERDGSIECRRYPPSPTVYLRKFAEEKVFYVLDPYTISANVHFLGVRTELDAWCGEYVSV